ncbi:hypothetical protein JB92DRAFT_2851757 [Gautieria morchelliformis]|nr:hypothetical protein JB92DRAFT_2851757 [Gautieria morchelliformis]
MAAVLDAEQAAPPPSSSMNFEELFNMDLYGPAASQSPGGPSRSSSNSPGSSFFSLPPPTPPQTQSDPYNPTVPDNSVDLSFFNFGLPQATFNKPLDLSANGSSPSEGTSPASSVPYDFFGSFAGGSGSTSSPDTVPSSAFSPKDLFAIDPTLVGATHRGEPEEESDDSEDDEDDQPIMKPVKVGGKGKAARKGTVASGGVVKRTPGGSAVKDKAANDDDWRPSPEEYKKMSSKEKRQLRNKISARNFRVRRKEYITTLEGDIAERDSLIDAIREELGSTKLENVALRQEVDALKRAMLEGRANPVLPPPAPLTATPSVANTKRSTRTLNKPNTKKDLPTSPRATPARAFWGGSNSAFGGAGGITPVHATLVPDFPAFSEKQSQRDQQENINPALNLPCFGGVGTTTPNPKFPLSPFQQPNLGANFDAFADLNPFTLKTLDAYRMQLWGRMAREAGAQQAQQRQRAQSPVQSHLTSALRPAFFTASSIHSKERDTTKHPSPTLSALLSGKPSGPSSSTTASASPRAAEMQPQHAMLASLASQTLLSKMGSAFWDAFARPGPATAASSPATSATGRGAKADWDHDKVRKVLEGKAVVRVVDVDTPASGSSTDALEESMRTLSLAGHSDSQSACAGIFLRTRAAVVGKK